MAGYIIESDCQKWHVDGGDCIGAPIFKTLAEAVKAAETRSTGSTIYRLEIARRVEPRDRVDRRPSAIATIPLEGLMRVPGAILAFNTEVAGRK